MARNADQPEFHILICLIEIWKPEDIDSNNPLALPTTKPTMIAECENIQINTSYTSLIDAAEVRFPRGTVIKRTVDGLTYTAEDIQVTATRDVMGIINEVKTQSNVASEADFAVDSRIRIYLGYATEPSIANLTKVQQGNTSIWTDVDKLNTYKKSLTLSFDGFIKQCCMDSTIILSCESLTTRLMRVSCKKRNYGSKTTVAQLLGSKYNILKGTGLTLHPSIKEGSAADITVGAMNLTSDLVVYDVLKKLQDMKIYPYLVIENDTPYIMVKRTYFSSPGEDSLISSNPSVAATIDFGYHVANNGLTTIKPNWNYLAVTASCRETDKKGMPTKSYHLTIRRKPNWDTSSDSKEQWQILNETHLSKKAIKRGAKVCSKGESKVDLSQYTVMTYISKKINCKHDDLLEEAIAFFESVNLNGIDGSLTLFGDLNIQTGSIVRLQDDRYTDKNGLYLVSEVSTSFGTSGYRQTIKLPYCIQSNITDRAKAETYGN